MCAVHMHDLLSRQRLNAAILYNAEPRQQQHLRRNRHQSITVKETTQQVAVGVACAAHMATTRQQQLQCHGGQEYSTGVERHTQWCRSNTRNSCAATSFEAVNSSVAAAAGDAAPNSAATSSSSGRAPEMCVIVDEHNNVIGAATRYETVSKQLLGRGAYVLVFNSTGQLFVSQRSKAKDCYPGCLDVTISGVVNQGEEYADTAARELQEEIGIPSLATSQKLQQLFIFPYQDNVCHVWGCAFSIIWDGPLVFRDAEVEWGQFMELAELQQQLEHAPDQFTPVGRHILGLYLEHAAKTAQQ